MSHNLNKLGSDWWPVLLSSSAIAALAAAHVGSLMLGRASGARRVHGRSCTWTHTHTHNTGSFMLPRQTAQCTAMTKQGSCALPHIPLARSMNADRPPPPRPKTLPGFPYRHHTSQNTPYTHLTCRQTPHLSRRPLAAPSDYIKKSSPLSGLSWPGYTKCHCQGQLVHGCSYCWGFNYTHMRNL